MPRKRSTIPWLHRWSRPLMAGIAAAGAAVTGYLTITKLTETATACPTEGCDTVLNSAYATLFGLPLALFGFIAYVSMAGLAIAPLLINATTQRKLQLQVEQTTGLLLFMGGTSMMIFSGYLMFLLAFKIQTACIYCLASAFFSLSLFLLSIVGRSWQDLGQLLFTGFAVGMVAFVGTLGIYAQTTNPVSSATGESGPPITTVSTPATVALAQHLTQVGAKMYGAYWCPHCHDQKQLFGQEAFSQVAYVECDPEGKNPQPKMCKDAKIKGYPTWKVKGQVFEGAVPLKQLAEASGYSGPQEF